MVILIMGVSGSGKTTVGQLLAQELGWSFHDADDYHPPVNIAKLSQGIALDDQDRAPWLAALGDAIATWLAQDQNVILACAALKSRYRQQLHVEHAQVQLVYLNGSRDLIAQRLQQRHNHFLNPVLLDSQFETLDEPLESWMVDIQLGPTTIVADLRARLGV